MFIQISSFAFSALSETIFYKVMNLMY
jgi:hypothetical protein